MVEHIRQQIIAQGAKLKPERTNARAKAERAANTIKTGNSTPLSERAEANMQQVRREAVGYGRRADVNTTFGCAVFVRRYNVLSEAEADRLDACFARIVAGLADGE